MTYPFFTNEFLGQPSNEFRFENFTITVVDYSSKVSENWHVHANAHISAIIRGGNLESRKSKELQVKPGRILTYEQGEIHRNRYTAHPSRNMNIEFEESFFDSHRQFSRFDPDENANLELSRIYFELFLNDHYSVQGIEQLVWSLFWSEKLDGQREWMLRLKEILHDQWKEFISLNYLSAELGIHPVTISKYFTKQMGMTLSEYMRRLKVKRATELLLNSSSTFAEVSFACGFSDQSHMTRLVKTYTGYTPKSIRSLR